MVRFPLLLIIIYSFISCNRLPERPMNIATPFLRVEQLQIDSLLLEMSLEEKIGQLILAKPNTLKKTWESELLTAIEKKQAGGIFLKNLPLTSFIKTSDSCRQLSDLPLFFATDEKVSLHNQFSDLPHFPMPSSMASIDSTAFQDILSGHYVKQCAALGINMSFAPSIRQIDFSDNSYDYQCFENESFFQLSRSLKMMLQLQKEKILSIGDHFDHLLYPASDTSFILDSILYQYAALTQVGLSGLKVSDAILELDTINKLPSYFIKNYFNRYLNFQGLIIAEVNESTTFDAVIHSGADVFITDDACGFHEYLLAFVQEGLMSQEALNIKVRKVLMAKSWIEEGNLNPTKQSSKKQVHFVVQNVNSSGKLSSTKLRSDYEDLIGDYFQDPAWPYLINTLFKKSAILLNNAEQLIPYSDILEKDFRIVQYSRKQLSVFKEYFSNYADYSSYLFPPNAKGELDSESLNHFKWTIPIIILDSLDLDSNLHQTFIRSLNQLSKKTKATLINFGNPLNLQYFDSTLTTIQIFERNDITEAVAAQILFGGMQGLGSLPIAINEDLPFRKSTETEVIRMQYAEPEKVGIKSSKLNRINQIATDAIRGRATPGCQIVVAKKGTVVYSEVFGHHTYQKRQRVKKDDIYDLASLTKIAATTLASMQLYEADSFKMEDKIGAHLSNLDSASIKDIKLKGLFIHQSGLQPHMPIAKFISRKDTTHESCNRFFCTTSTDSFSVKISNSLFFKEIYQDSIWDLVYNLPLRRNDRFRYSDVNFNLIQKVIDSKIDKPLNEYMYEKFYHPLGLSNILFKPLEKIAPEKIVPTEEDKHWRKELLRGYVHDETAALMGGVAGNAGLFGNAEDLTILFQMVLDDGKYGDQTFLKKSTIDLFTSAQHGNHRGLGFDKPSPRRSSAFASSASPQTFGHTGFTGTCIWVDPKHDLIFVFLSNRIHPNSFNRRLFREGVRRRMHEVIYNALGTFESELPELNMSGKKG